MRLLVRAAAAVLALGTLLLLLRRELLPWSTLNASDFITYLGAAATVRHGGNPFVPVATWIAQYHGGALAANYYVYSPAFALLLVPLTFLSAHLAWMLWGGINLLCLAGTVYCALRAARRPAPLWLVLILTAAVALLSPVRMDLQWGQADCLITLLLSASFLAVRQRHPTLCGILLGVAATVKTPLLALVLFYLWKREWRAALAALCTALLLLGLPPLALGGTVLRDQLTIWRFWSSHYTSFIDNIAPRGLLARLFASRPTGPGLLHNPSLAVVLWLAVSVVCLALTARILGRKALQEGDAPLLHYGAALGAVLLISPLTEWIYLTLLCIPLLYCAILVLPAKQWTARPRFTLVLLLLYLLLCAPLNHLEYSAAAYIPRGGVVGTLAVLGAAVYLYPLLLTFALSLAAVRGTPETEHRTARARSLAARALPDATAPAVSSL